MKKPGLSRNGRATLLVAICSLVLIVLIWTSLFRQLEADKSQTISSAIQRNENLVVALEHYAVRTIFNADAVLQLVRSEFLKSGGNPNVKSVLIENSISNEFFNGVSVVDKDGYVVNADFQIDPANRPNLRDREHFKYHLNNPGEELYIGKPVMSRTLSKTIIPFTRKLTDSSGRFMGIVSVQIEPSVFMRFYAEADLRPNDLISLIAFDGTTYSRRTGQIVSFGENIIKSPLFQHVKQNPVNSYFAKDAIRGIPTYFSYRQLSEYPMIATVGTAEKDVLADYYKRSARDYFSAIVISVLILLFAVLVLIAFRHRIKNQEKVKISEEKYRSIVQNSHDAILLLQEDGRISAVNTAACSIFGFTEDVICNKKFLELVDASDPHFSKMENEGLLGNMCKREMFFTRRNGSRFPGEMVASFHKNALGEKRFIVIIRDITERKLAAEKRLAEQKRFQRKLTQQVILAQEREREAIGRELHDNVNQVLTMVKLYLEMAMNNSETADEILPKSIDHVMHCINEIRNLSRDLSAPTLGTKSLVDSINALIEMIQSSSGLQIRFYHQSYHHPLKMDQKLAVYRILQEQLNNVIKHARATEVSVLLSQHNNTTTISIRDNGNGFDTSSKRNGIGLNNILSRAKVLDGKVQIFSDPGKGCELVVSIPTVTNSTDEQSAAINVLSADA